MKNTMKRSQKKMILAVSIWLILSSLVGGAVYTFYTVARSFVLQTRVPHSVSVHIGHIYSDSLRADLEQFITEQTTPEQLCTFNPEEFCRNLKRHFRIVRSVAWNMVSRDQAHITITGTEPEFLINDRFIMGNKRRLFERSSFENYALPDLKVVQVMPEYLGEKIQPEIYQFLQKIPIRTLDRYTVICKGLQEIVLIEHKTDRLAMIIVDEKILFDEGQMNKAYVVPREKVMHDMRLISRRNLSNKTVVYDMRFGDRIYIKC